MTFILATAITLLCCFIGIPLILGLARLFGIFTTIEECHSKVYVLFGKVLAVIDEPGLHILPFKIGFSALIIHFLGRVYDIDHRLDQEYLRSQPVNSEEGTPMGIGIWHEMYISDPVKFLFNNTDPRGSLRANLSNATVRCLSNMPLDDLMQNRHAMSRIVRVEVCPKSEAWGYRLGSVYVRKVHFRDLQMIHQIEQKVVNRLRQVTSAIRQQGANQVDIVKSKAEKEAAAEFAHAQAMRPYLVGLALQEISNDPEIMNAVFEILETKKMLEGDVEFTLIPGGQTGDILSKLLASKSEPPPQSATA